MKVAQTGGDRSKAARLFTLLTVGLPLCLVDPASGLGREARHGLSVFGDLKYPKDFKHFDFVNPNAPKGGRLSMIGATGVITFNSFNGYILKGDPAQGLGYLSSGDHIYDSLMVRAWDEPDAVYGLVAHSVELADDKKSITFFMRPEARFADGSEVTVEDAAFTLNILKGKCHPALRFQLRDVKGAEVLDRRTIRYLFRGKNNRDLPLIVAQLLIFSKAYYATREFDKTTLEPPLGSGPYRIDKFKQGTFVSYRRRPDYWASDLPVNRGRNNFDELRYEYYRDRGAEFEALKAGAFDLREEFTAKVWATQYDIPPVRDGRLIREVLAEKIIGANSRRELTIAARAVDRVLRAEHYWIPHWYKGSHTIAYWNKYSRPKTKPRYSRGIIYTWWYDMTKAAKLTQSN